MQEEKTTGDELTLASIFRAIVEKLWIVIVVTLGGAILGGLIGYLSNDGKYYYGASLNYYVSSKQTDSEQTSDSLINPNNYAEGVLKTICVLLESDEYNEKLMSGFEETKDYQSGSAQYVAFMKKLSFSISYSYAPEDEHVNRITVRVSVLNNPEFAAQLLAQVKVTINDFVSAKMNQKSFGSTNCMLLNDKASHWLNPSQTKTQTIKFALIFALAAAVVAVLVVVVLDRADTRIREYDEISAKFRLPVLGVIPKIENIGADAIYSENKEDSAK